jgi:hypothetical protein
MPFKSNAQRKWANSPTGKKELGKKTLDEFNEASKGKKLPEKIKSKKHSKK